MHRLNIHSIQNKGDLADECVWLDVTEDISNLSYYVFCDATYTDEDHTSVELRQTYWFPKKRVSSCDWIRLMTKAETNAKLSNDRHTTTHTLFWGLGRTIRNNDGDCAVLLKLQTWKTRRA